MIVCECHSEDETWNFLQSLAQLYPGLRLVRHPWGDHSSIQSTICNWIIEEHVETDWHFKLDADECLHEDGIGPLRACLERADEKGITAILPHYTHFVANYDTTFPFIYDRVIRIARKDAGWLMPGDACQLADGQGETYYDPDIQVFHYGKVRSGPTALQKEKSFQQLYVDQGFPDPKLKPMEEEIGRVDWFYIFQNTYEKGEFKPFRGRHPIWMIPVIMADTDKQYEPIMAMEGGAEFYCETCDKAVDGPNCSCGRQAERRR